MCKLVVHIEKVIINAEQNRPMTVTVKKLKIIDNLLFIIIWTMRKVQNNLGTSRRKKSSSSSVCCRSSRKRESWKVDTLAES